MVENLRDTVAFYRDVLGFDLVMTAPEEGPLVWVLLRRGDVEIMFQSREELTQLFPELAESCLGGTLTFFVAVEDAAALYDRLKERVTVLRALHTRPDGTREFSIRDVNNFVLTFAGP